jgi:hypothetical protein
MLCAHTIRRLEPGTFDQFARTFGPPEDVDPGNWVRFHVLRSLTDENEVITFGFFDGTLEEMQRSQDELGYEAQKAAIAPLVQAVVANGVYEIAVTRVADKAPAA